MQTASFFLPRKTVRENINSCVMTLYSTGAIDLEEKDVKLEYKCGQNSHFPTSMVLWESTTLMTGTRFYHRLERSE